MKSTIKYLLHNLLGFNNYLFVFSLFKIYTLKRDKNEKDFFHFLRMIPENTIVLDIGANIGIMSVHLARSVKNSIVYSFEPIPNNIKAFKRIINYFKLKNVRLFEIALGNSEGQVEMVMPVISSVRMQGLSHVVHSSITENNEGERFKAPLKMLDKIEALQTAAQRISAIKIDVENFEYFVLDGARELITKNKPVVYAELWENENREKCFELFQQLDYNTFVVFDNKLVKFDKTRNKTQNFIFVPV
ncbi:MAG: FkbM family methyltransferase [Bacteroidota bacterium]